MTLSQLFSRQKLVVLPMVVLVVLGLAWVYKAGPPVFQAKASIALMTPADRPANVSTSNSGADTGVGTGIPSTTTTTTDPGNPLLRYDDQWIIPDLVTRLLTTPRVEADLRRQGLQGTYDLGRSTVFPYRGPIVDITTSAPTADAARRDGTLLVKEVQTQLDRVEDSIGVPAHQRIVTTTVVVPTNVNIQYAKRMKRMMMGLILGIAAIIVVARASDAIGRRRRMRSVGATASSDAALDRPGAGHADVTAGAGAPVGASASSAARPGGASPRPVGPAVHTSA